MNKTNGLKEQASASTSLYTKEHIKTNQRSSTSGLSFLKWFKKSEKSSEIDSRCSTKSIGRNFHSTTSHHKNHFHNNSHETISPSSSPNFGYLSPSSSCDSVESTSTTGFAFIKPNNYKPSSDIAQRTIFTQDFDETTSYQTSNAVKPNLTLRTKYCLYDADTLTSTEGDYDNIRFGDRSLPHLRKKFRENQSTLQRRRRSRRTVSDSSKDKKSGAYVHVRGKRRAPPPPPPPQSQLTNGTASHDISNKSTLNRKKRRAPPPPSSPNRFSSSAPRFVVSNGLLNDMDIKALIRSSSPNTRINQNVEVIVKRNSSQFTTSEPEDFTAAEKLTEQQKQAILDNIVKVTQSTSSSEAEVQTPPPTSPISPRPWYKRPISSHRDSSIPFKREVVLKTMEKRKSKEKGKNSKADNLPEVSHSRSSIFEASSKFGFFLRGKDHGEKDKEKRRSGIGIPNISELDREAAEIVHREYASAHAANNSESERFFTKSDHITLQQEMFGFKTNIEGTNTNSEEEEREEPIKSTKDLISKFESSSSGPRITVNTSFIGRKDNFVRQDSENSATKSNKSPPIEAKNDKTDEKIQQNNSSQIDNKENDTKIQAPRSNLSRPDDSATTRISWTCAFCTLENPGWRIICEACERIKPYDKRTSIEGKVAQNVKVTAVIPKKEENLNNNLNNSNNKLNKSEHTSDWEKKTEKVLKYFMSKAGNSGPLVKSSSETSVGKHQLVRKSPSPNKPPSGSPQFGLRNRLLNKNQADVTRSSGFLGGFRSTNTIPEEKENISPTDERKRPLLDSSVIITTITPVFYASTTLVKSPQVAILGETELPTKEVLNSEVKPTTEEILKGATETEATTNIAKIDVTEVRKARLAKFSVPQVSNVSTELPIPIYDHDSLEREKKRLRDMIQAMNAKALAEKYPLTTGKKASPPAEEVKRASTVSAESIQPPESKPSSTNDQVKLGAIKKVFAKNRNSDQVKRSPDPDAVKPKKVSTSVQTTGVVSKKSLTPEETDKQQINIYANMPIYENSPLEKFDKNVKLTETDKAKVQQISQQLTSVQGINDFRESLKNADRGISATDTIALSKIMRSLETAIAEGQHELAAQIAIDLARMKVSLHVTKQRDRPTSRADIDFEKNILVDMFVEDKYSQKGPIQISITPLYTIAKLKQKIATDFDIPIGVQRWLVNDDLALDDDKTLLEFGVRDPSATFYLYIVAADVHFYEVKKTNINSNFLLPKTEQPKPKDPPKAQIEDVSKLGATALPNTKVPVNLKGTKPTWACSLCTLINSEERTSCLACTKPRPKDKQQQQLPQQKQPVKQPAVVQLRPAEKRNDLNKSTPNRRSTDVYNIVDIKIDIKKTITDQMKPLPNGASPNITRTKYRGVDNFNPNRKKGEAPKPNPNWRINKNNATQQQEKKISEQDKNHYLELLSLDNADIVPNVEAFECPICFMKCEKSKGVILRDCLHTFCKECLAHTIQYSEDAEVRCPYMDTEYSCDSVLQEREVRALVSKDIYELHLVKSMRMAEHQIENAFHCKTPNCRGWCIYEDNVNEFKCPVCRITNCLTCRVIHDGLTCKQYQDRLNSDCDSNIDAKRTKEMLEEMLKKGEAMNCPTCQVVMMKKWGCDWLKCSMCKTEVCWVTRGPRWGPGGKGDTTAGCKCGVDNIKCHPKCNYCH